MFKYQKSAVTSLEVFQVFCPQSKPTYVKGRSFHSLTYRQKGTVTLDTDECSISSGHGHITYVPKGMPYTTTVLEDSSIIAIHFEMDEDTFFPTPFTEEDKTGALGILFKEIAQNYTPSNPFNYEAYSLFYQILSVVEAQLIYKNQLQVHPKIQTAMQLIDKNFRDNNFNISSVVEELKISDSFLRREFKKSFGISPVQYLTKVRIESAKVALSSDYYSVENIAEQNGFSSSSYFIQVFRKETGFSPLSYKKHV